MGACGSSEAGVEDTEQKKRSQAIDRKLEEDSKRLRRECKILLLGKRGEDDCWKQHFVLTC
jgi:guanine nucleotide-binding protein G(i) subunit alpha